MALETWLAIDPTTQQPVGAVNKPVGKQPTQKDLNSLPGQQMQAVPPTYAAPKNDQLSGFQTDYDTPEAQALLQELEANRRVAYDQGQQGVGQYEQLLQQHLDKTQNDPKLDLSPLMSLSDQWFGGNLAQNYRAPTTSRGALETTAALQQGLQKAKGSLIDDQQNYLNSRFNLLQKNTDTKLNAIKALTSLEEAKARGADGKAFKDEKFKLEQKQKYDKEFGQVINGSSTFITSANRVKDIIRNNGGNVPLSGPAARELESEVGGMVANYNKYVAGLGALSGPDAKIIENKIGISISAIPNMLAGNVKGGGEATIRVLDNIVGNMKEAHERTKKRVKTLYGGYADDALSIDDETFKLAAEGKLYGKPNAQQSSGKPSTVIQNGVTYTLNPQTGEYE